MKFSTKAKHSYEDYTPTSGSVMVLFQFRQSVPIEEGVIAMHNMTPRPIRSPLIERIAHLYHKQFLFKTVSRTWSLDVLSETFEQIGYRRRNLKVMNKRKNDRAIQ